MTEDDIRVTIRECWDLSEIARGAGKRRVARQGSGSPRPYRTRGPDRSRADP